MIAWTFVEESCNVFVFLGRRIGIVEGSKFHSCEEAMKELNPETIDSWEIGSGEEARRQGESCNVLKGGGLERDVEIVSLSAQQSRIKR